MNEDTLVITAEPAQTIVWSMPARYNAYDPSGYLIRQDVVNGKVNDIVKQHNVKDILVIGSMSPFVDKVTQELKVADTTGVPIKSKVI